MSLINLAVLVVLGIVVISVVVAARRGPGKRGGVIVVAGIAVVIVTVAVAWAFSWALAHP